METPNKQAVAEQYMTLLDMDEEFDKMSPEDQEAFKELAGENLAMRRELKLAKDAIKRVDGEVTIIETKDIGDADLVNVRLAESDPSWRNASH